MWRYVYAFPDGRIYNRAVGGKDLRDSFETFIRVHWRPDEPPGALAVFQNHALVARVLVAMDKDTGDLVPFLQELSTVTPSPPSSLACGD